MMAGVDVKEKAIIANSKNDGVTGDVTGIIGLSNEQIKGSMAISLPEDMGKIVVANMLAVEPDDISDEELKDGLGEITNMVAGDFNNRMGSIFKLSLPSVITGKRHVVSLTPNDKLTVFKFFALDDYFHLLTTFEEQNKK
ncbi:MAG: hypothetical protein DRG39_03805 [Deltaproteobacteria bacterium]|nr:MAG: hypothetical protein DRG39_03805 [Deltaproteobacteria bacterium]